MGKRTKKDVDAAYQRGFKDGYNEAVLHSFRMAVSTTLKKRHIRRFNERTARLGKRSRPE